MNLENSCVLAPKIYISGVKGQGKVVHHQEYEKVHYLPNSPPVRLLNSSFWLFTNTNSKKKVKGLSQRMRKVLHFPNNKKYSVKINSFLAVETGLLGPI